MKYYVTFQVKPTSYFRMIGMKTRRYAIECCTIDIAYEIASDVNSLDGVTYVRINKSGTIHKDAIIINGNGNYIKDIK